MRVGERRGLRLKLPATSANLGPGFDAAGLALSLHLSLEAEVAPTFQMVATGRSAELCGALEGNLILETYREVLAERHREAAPLRVTLHNEIPLGAGCGSSAAALLAGVALADHFGALKMTDEAIVAEASRREGHPDNVAACWYGGFTVSAQVEDGRVEHATFAADAGWEMLVVMQGTPLATAKARALLPDRYVRADAVFNVQRVALLTAAFAAGDLGLLRTATEDRMHQPYREVACPLLGALLPLAKEPEIAAVTLSGAGPSVLVFLSEGTTVLEAETRVRALVEGEVEVLAVRVAGGVERTFLSE
jgi:homoserine kinase